MSIEFADDVEDATVSYETIGDVAKESAGDVTDVPPSFVNGNHDM